MVNVLVVEDSSVVSQLLVHILSSDPDVRVIATARNGSEALDAVRRYRPDVITMDIHMPVMDGLEATRLIMETMPTPIIIVSGSEDPQEVMTTFSAMELGALAILRRPMGIGHPDYPASADELVTTVKLMSEVKVVRRWPRSRHASLSQRQKQGSTPAQSSIRVVAIGASTGGPPVLQTILSMLPRDFPVPIVIVQHMADGFIKGFSEWLGHSASLPVQVAANGEVMLPGHVYVAPDGCQMRLERGARIALTKDKREHGLCPSVSYLFRSIAEIYGGDAIAGLLTGMGRDGAEELKLLKDEGAVTFVQDKDSSVVHGMPGEAIKLDAAMLILPPEKIAPLMMNLTKYHGRNGVWS